MIGNGMPNNHSSAPRPILMLTTSYGPDIGRALLRRRKDICRLPGRALSLLSSFSFLIDHVFRHLGQCGVSVLFLFERLL